MMTADGILVVDKPKKWTSHDVVSFVRKKFRFKKVGHGGSLDPIATGVLVLLIGKYTKKANVFLGAQKEYMVELCLGEATDTGDADGRVIKQDHATEVPLEKIKTVLAQFQGELEQVPPMYSAIKYKGKPLYELARKGVVVERAPRMVFIYTIELIEYRFPTIAIRVVSSKGTYIRTLCEQIGEALGTVAYMSALKGIRCGELHNDDAFTVDAIRSMTAQELSSHIKKLDR